MSCHPERSEGSDWPGTEILRCAQDDKTGFGWENSVEHDIVSSTIGTPEPEPTTLRWMNADGWRVVMARAIRSFGYGFTSILLGITLTSAGFSTIEVGLVLTTALVGDIIAIIPVSYTHLTLPTNR